MKGTKVEFLRTIKGFTQEYIAHKSQIELSKYKRIEADLNKATKEELEVISKILGTNSEDLLNPNPYIIQIFNLPNKIANDHYMNLYSEFLFSKEDKNNHLDKLIDTNNKLASAVDSIAKDINKVVLLFEKKIN